MKQFIYILPIFFSASILISCGSKTTEVVAEEEHHDEMENSVELTDEQFKGAGIEMGKMVQRQISGTIKVNGMLDVPPQQLISVSVPLGGFLKNTDMLQGTRVKKGQIIATIENMDFIQLQQDYLESKSQFQLAQTDYNRQQELAKENVNAKKTLEQAEANYTGLQARQMALREKLKMINIDIASLEAGVISGSINLYSPIDGYVTQVYTNIGKFLSPTDILFEIVDTQHLHAELTVFEKDIPKIKIGQKVRFTLANERVERTATVFLTGREIDKDRTIRIHCHIDKMDPNLLPGMYLKAEVETGGAWVSALPDEAVVDFQGKKYIFVLRDGQLSASKNEKPEGVSHFEMLEVQTGNSETGYTEILSNENLDVAKLQLVVKGAYSLLSKMKNREDGQEHGH